MINLNKISFEALAHDLRGLVVRSLFRVFSKMIEPLQIEFEDLKSELSDFTIYNTQVSNFDKFLKDRFGSSNITLSDNTSGKVYFQTSAEKQNQIDQGHTLTERGETFFSKKSELDPDRYILTRSEINDEPSVIVDYSNSLTSDQIREMQKIANAIRLAGKKIQFNAV